MIETMLYGLIAWNIMLTVHIIFLRKDMTRVEDLLAATCKLVKLGMEIGFDELATTYDEVQEIRKKGKSNV